MARFGVIATPSYPRPPPSARFAIHRRASGSNTFSAKCRHRRSLPPSRQRQARPRGWGRQGINASSTVPCVIGQSMTVDVMTPPDLVCLCIFIPNPDLIKQPVSCGSSRCAHPAYVPRQTSVSSLERAKVGGQYDVGNGPKNHMGKSRPDRTASTLHCLIYTF